MESSASAAHAADAADAADAAAAADAADAAASKAAGIPHLPVVRAKVVARFARSLGDDAAAWHLARQLDTLLWNWTLLACERDHIPRYWTDKRLRYRYTTRALGLDFNLHHPKNPALRSKSLSLRRLMSMTPQQMFPEFWKEVYERVAAKQLRRLAATMDPETAPDGAYTCGKCKSRKTVYSSMQIRSADEPMTNFVTCLACGKNWKD